MRFLLKLRKSSLQYLLWATLGAGSLGVSATETVETATAPAATVAATRDPYESVNRQVFAFNAWLVREVVDPTANVMAAVLPESVQQAGHNIYNNLVEPEFIVTNLFAGNTEGAKVSGQRFLINSTLGVAGLWDAASWLGYERNEVEFIQSICAADLNPGDYVVLPAIGPANAYAAASVTGFFAVEWYMLAIISSTIATADLVVDISASAASLRNSRDIPGEQVTDPYEMQRAEFFRYLDTHCGRPDLEPLTAVADQR